MQYSIVNLSEVKENSFGFTILSPDFYMPGKLKYLEKLKSGKTILEYFSLVNKKITHLPKIQSAVCYDLAHSLTNFLEKGEHTCKIESTKKIAKKGDFIISRLRSYLKEMSIVPEENKLQLFSTEYLIYRTKNKDLFSNNSLMAFCMSEYVQTILKFSQYGTEHPRFYEFVLNNIKIPKSVENTNSELTLLLNNALNSKQKADNLYSEAKNILLKELNLLNYKPEHKLFFEKNLSDTVSAERMDAEYFQPKYDEIIKHIKNYKNGFDKLENLVNINDKNFNPKSNEIYKYVELANISINGETTGCAENKGKDLPSRARRLIKLNDLIVSSVEGSLDKIAIINEELENSLCSTGFYILASQILNSETLLMFFKSIAGQMQLKRGCKGTILTAIPKEELEKIVIPKIDNAIQQKIKEYIQKMYKARQTSKLLLKTAKKAVETAIEKDEPTAFKFIETEIQNIAAKF